MNTSYFAKYKGSNGVSIALKAPYGFRGKSYKILAPTWSILSQYKKIGNVQIYTERYYKEVLDMLDPEKVYNDLKGRVLLCWERSDKFCHRHLVAEWIFNNLGIKVNEI